MEFFSEVSIQGASSDLICELVTIARLPILCASIDTVLSDDSEGYGEIYCVWGQFQVSREKIRNGVRFSLLNCPHALAWTVAAHGSPAAVVVHCTIDDKVAEEEFAESIEQFVEDFAEGLRGNLHECA